MKITVTKVAAFLTASATLCVMGTLLVFYSADSPAAETNNPDLTIENRTLVSQQRVSRTEIEYTYTADLVNQGPDISGATVTVSSSSPYTTVIDGDLQFDEVASGTAATSTDTFTIRQNRRYPFDPEGLTYSVTSSTTLLDEGELGFTLDYPSEWNLNPGTNGVELLGFTTESNPGHYLFRVLIRRNDNPQLLPVLQWFDQDLRPFLDGRESPPAPYVVDGHEAIRVNVTEINASYTYVYVARNTDIVEIIFPDSDVDLLPTYESILANVQFSD